MKSTLKENAADIQQAKPNVNFDVTGNEALLDAKKDALNTAEGKLSQLEQQKLSQTNIANRALDDYYKAASNLADAIVGHVGKDHKLLKLIRNKRESMSHESPTMPEPPSVA